MFYPKLTLQKHGLMQTCSTKSPITFGTAERKLIIVFLYYITLGAVSLTGFTLFARYAEGNIVATAEYFDCEKMGGQNNTQECSLNTVVYPSMALVSYTLLGLFPAINLVFAVNTKELKSAFEQLFVKTITVVHVTKEHSISSSSK